MLVLKTVIARLPNSCSYSIFFKSYEAMRLPVLTTYFLGVDSNRKPDCLLDCVSKDPDY